MIEFGSTLRAAREAKGYTQAQVAEITRMAPSTVAELENEDFRRIPAPIYGRGFVKLYCSAVGIDAKPLVDEFMDIFSGNRDTGIKERPVAVTPPPKPNVEDDPIADRPMSAPPAAAEPQPAAAEPPPTTITEPDLFSQPPVTHPADDFGLFDRQPTSSPAPRTPTPPPRESAPEPFKPETKEDDQHALSRYASPIRTIGNRPLIPPTFWRMGVLAVGVLILLGLVYTGLSSLHSAVSGTKPASAGAEASTPAVTETATVADQETETSSAKKPSAPRTPQKIPALYID